MISPISFLDASVAPSMSTVKMPKSSELGILIEDLKLAGFNSTDIKFINSKVPDLQFKIFPLRPDQSAKEIASEALTSSCADNCPVVFKLNGKVIIVNSKTRHSQLEEQCSSLIKLALLDSLSLEVENQSFKNLRIAINLAYRTLPGFLQDWVDDRVINDDFSTQPQVTKIAIDALRLYAHFETSHDLISYWSRFHDCKLTESDPRLHTSHLILSAKVVMVKFDEKLVRH